MVFLLKVSYIFYFIKLTVVAMLLIQALEPDLITKKSVGTENEGPEASLGPSVSIIRPVE